MIVVDPGWVWTPGKVPTVSGLAAADRAVAERIVKAEKEAPDLLSAARAVARILIELAPADRADTIKLAIAFGAHADTVNLALKQVGDVVVKQTSPVSWWAIGGGVAAAFLIMYFWKR